MPVSLTTCSVFCAFLISVRLHQYCTLFNKQAVLKELKGIVWLRFFQDRLAFQVLEQLTVVYNTGTTTNPTQAIPSVEPASTVMSPGVLTTAVTSSAAPQAGLSRARGGVTSPPAEEETTTTLITTTTITTVHTPGTLNKYPLTVIHLASNESLNR